MKIQPDKTTLIWQCPVCFHEASSFANSLVEAGTAVCPDCDCDMILDHVEVETERTMTATLTAINSNQDRFGNRYWALRFVDHATRKVVEGKISGGESNINAIRRVWNTNLDDWDRSIVWQTQSLPVREFNSLTKDWGYAGCNPEDLVTYIRTKLEE